MSAESLTRLFGRIAVPLALLSCAGCYHREANILVAPVPIQVDGDRVEGRGVPLVGPRWHRIEPGMTKEQVIHFVGEPTHREYEGNFTIGNREVWYFDSYDVHDGHFDPHKVAFEHGRVIYALFDEKRLAEKKKERATIARVKRVNAIVPDDVGQRCETGDVCASRSCINNRCAGPDGCTRAIGDACLSGLDCCSHKCNAGAMVCE